jgi:type I restriction enzyme S subunit
MTKTQYKQTPIGLIPTDWEVKRISDATTYVDYRGKTPQKTNDGILLLTARNIKSGYIDYNISNEYITSQDYSSVMSRGLPELGDILFTTEAPMGNVAQINRTDIALAQRVIKFRAKPDLLTNDYLKYYLLSEKFQKLLDEKSTGGTAKGIKGSTLHTMALILPPLPEQQKIAEILSTWDKAIQEVGLLLKKIEVRKKALAFSLLTGRKRVKGFEGKWEITNFGKIISRVTKKNEELDDTVVTISAKRGFILQEDFFNKRVASDTLSGYYLLEKGQFAYNKSYSNGYPMGVFKRLNDFDKAVVTTLYICFELKENICSDFMVHYFDNGLMNTNLIKIAKEGGRAHGLLNIGIEDFMNLKITMPSLEEQTAIAEILNTAQQELKQYQEKLKALQQQKKGLMQQLLTGKIRTV